MQGIKITKRLDVQARNAIWEEVAVQVTRQGCMLGHHATTPPTLGPAAAEAAAQGPVEPVTSA